MASKRKLLGDLPLFSACTSRELSRIASVARRVDAEQGDVLATEGRPGRLFYVIEKGTARVLVGDREVARLGAGDSFGEMALLDQGPRSATVVAEEPMRLYVIGAEEFGRLLEEVPFLTRKILRGVSNRLRSAEQAPAYVWNRF